LHPSDFFSFSIHRGAMPLTPNFENFAKCRYRVGSLDMDFILGSLIGPLEELYNNNFG